MTQPRRFSMTPVAAEEGESFIVDGTRISDGEPWEETFTVPPGEIPPGAHVDLLNAYTVNENGEAGWQAWALTEFIRAVIPPDEEARWHVLCRDKDRPLQSEQLAEIMFWITKEKVGRPIGRRSFSSDGSPIVNNGSEADSSPADVTPTGSTPAD